MMGVIWREMGVIHWPMGFSLLVVLVLTVWSALRLVADGPNLRTKIWIDAILFWGGFAVVTGLLGTTVGIVFAASAIEAAGAVSSSMMWGGIRVALLSTAFGILILAFAALSWFLLQMRWRLLTVRGQGPARV